MYSMKINVLMGTLQKTKPMRNDMLMEFLNMPL